MRHSLCAVMFLTALIVLLPSVHAKSEPMSARIWVSYDWGGDSPTLYVLNTANEVLAEYPIVTPAPWRTPSCITKGGTVTGTVTDIDHRAWWYPTDNTKKAMRKKGVYLKSKYAPDDPRNALAGKKLWIAWDDPCIASTVRIHATHKEEKVRERARESFGCIRMIPEDWLAMATAIAPGARVTLSATNPPTPNTRLSSRLD